MQIFNKNKTIDISVVVPIYNELENAQRLVNSIVNVLDTMNKEYEVILVDDGSTDGTTQLLQEISENNNKVKSIIFRRNYGQTPAMQAGFDYAQGDVVITLDGDLQNDPTDIPMLIAKLEEGYDVVSGWRKDRQDDLISRKIPSMIANRLISKLTRVKLHDYGCSLKAYTKQVAKDLTLYGEMHRFIPALAYIEGAKVVEVPVKHHARQFGVSKYNILRTFKVVLDLMTVVFLRKFMTRPLHMFGRVGLASLALGFMAGFYLLIDKFVFLHNIGNRPLLLLSVLLVLTGIQLISTGIVAEVVSRTYFEAQNKAIYKIKDVFNKN